MQGDGLHDDQPVYAAGVPLEEARGVVILAHGRGATAASILELADLFEQPDLAYLAPQAKGNTWYPNSFLAPLESNEPWLSSALGIIGDLVVHVEEAGIAARQIVLGGFSQGACLVSEYVARRARRYGGLLAFSGGVIGPPGTPREYPGSAAGMPVFLGCSDMDPHIPLARVEETAAVFTALQALVTKRIYPRMGHTINQDEIDHARTLLAHV
jgi:predicted esterase